MAQLRRKPRSLDPQINTPLTLPGCPLLGVHVDIQPTRSVFKTRTGNELSAAWLDFDLGTSPPPVNLIAVAYLPFLSGPWPMESTTLPPPPSLLKVHLHLLQPQQVRTKTLKELTKNKVFVACSEDNIIVSVKQIYKCNPISISFGNNLSS